MVTPPILNRRLVLRSVMALCLALFACIGLAQSLSPTWMAGGWQNLPNQPSYSWNGSRVIVWNDNRIIVYNAPSGTLAAELILDGKNGNMTSACLNPNGTVAFFSTDQGKVYDFDIATRNVVALNISEGSGNAPTLLSPSKNGKYLAYVAKDPINSDQLVCIYDVATATFAGRWDNTTSAGAQTTVSIGFVNSDSDVVLSGPAVYSLTGTLIASSTDAPQIPVLVAPNESAVYAYYDNQSVNYCPFS